MRPVRGFLGLLSETLGLCVREGKAGREQDS